MPTIVRKTSWGMVGGGLAAVLVGLGLVFLQFGTTVFVSDDGSTRRVSIKLLLLAGGAVLLGLGMAFTGTQGRACSACGVALDEREGHHHPTMWPHLRAAFDALRAGDPRALAQLAQSPRAEHYAPGVEIAAIRVEGCSRCGQVAEVSIARKVVKQDDADVVESAEPVVVQGPVAQHLMQAMPREASA